MQLQFTEYALLTSKFPSYYVYKTQFLSTTNSRNNITQQMICSDSDTKVTMRQYISKALVTTNAFIKDALVSVYVMTCILLL